jgi:3-deoxy-manno-octulosonate cytidylyltransferase (CMP-KDO synthetase)
MTAFNVVIPARFASARLPGKPLADIGGVPMIARVARRAAESGAARVLVASDDQRVLDALAGFACEGRMTRPDHVSGSDRVMEVAEACDWTNDTVVVNVQGDEPFIPPAVIAQVAELLIGNPDVGVATLCEPITSREQVFDPNVVKVVRGSDDFARYFSRAPIPYARDAFADGAVVGALPESGRWYRHIGIYGYRLGALRQFVGIPPGALESGIGILLADAVAPVPGGVDTEADLERARRSVGG